MHQVTAKIAQRPVETLASFEIVSNKINVKIVKMLKLNFRILIYLFRSIEKRRKKTPAVV